MMTTLLDIGQALVDARMRLGMTQGELGRRVGVTQPQIARWESAGYATAGLMRVSQVAEALGVSVAEKHVSIAAEQATSYAASAADIEARALRRLGVSLEAIAAFSRSHGICRFELFGSILTGDFTPASDVDVLVTYEPGRTPGLFGANDQEAELSAMFRRSVDLVTRSAVERSDNYIRKRGILDNATVIYER